MPCYQNFTCTRLLVPLDYDDPSIGETAIPFLRYASPNKSAEDLLFNPGGPAGSGINQVRTEPLFKMALNFVGTSHNFVTFDPRGVNSSDISLSCFQNSPANGMLYDNAMSQPINMNSPESFAVRYARDKAYGQWCGKALNGTNAKYANSVAVARDMLHYIETAKKQAGGDPKSAKLRFFGISYGTVLGAAFASLYPDRVERMVLDGVSDAGEYFSGTWYTALDSADRAMRFFFQKCFEAGPELCAFYEDSPLKIELRYNKLLTNVEAHPIVFSEPTIMQVPWTLTVADLISSVLKLLYVPMNTFPLLGEMLKGAEERNGTWIAYQAGSPAINANITPNAYIDYDIAQPTIQIRCLDASGRFPMKNLTQYKEYIEAQKKVTSYFGALGDTDAIKCTDMGLLPPSNQQFIQSENFHNRKRVATVLIESLRWRSASRKQDLPPNPLDFSED